jgi:hypothetical protein
MSCPFLAYRTGDADHEFDTPRAYCTAQESFVQPMRADVCNDRYDLAHDTDCEIYLAHADEPSGADAEETGGSDASGASGGDEG